jgi:tripartite-type tricarboxylate transporter receptor subunit TctC
MARTLGEAVGSSLGRFTVVENKPGAFGSVAVAALKQAPNSVIPLFIGDWAALGTNVELFKALAYNPITDFEPITALLSFPVVLYSTSSSPFSSVASLREIARARSVTFASQGNGSPGHILGAMLSKNLTADLVHVPYRGSAPAMQDLLAGQVGILFDALPAGLPYVRENRLRPLAVMSSKRTPLLPEVPTAAEVGLEGMEMDVWFGIVARKGLSREMVQDLNKAFTEALASPVIAQRFIALGYEPLPMSSERFGQFMRSELARWSKVIRQNNISAE